MASIRVLSGAGRYTDPWHHFAASSQAAADVLARAGHQVCVVQTSHPGCLTELSDVDLVVVNAGAGEDPTEDGRPSRDPRWTAAHAHFGAWLDDGGRCLVLHTGINTFRDWPDWPRRVGGAWRPGVSGHPLRCIATFQAHPDAATHPALGGLDEVACYDERYWHLDVAPDSTPYLRHETDEHFYDVCWVSSTGVVYDALGHCPRSYSSAARSELLAAEAAWLLA